LTTTNPCCHGNEISDKIGYNSACVRDIPKISAYNWGFCRAGSTIWWALRTPQRRGPTGKLDAGEGEKGGEGVPLPNQLGVWGALYKLLGGKNTSLTIRILEISRRPL